MTTRHEPAFGDRPVEGEDHRTPTDRWSDPADDVPDPVDDGIAVGVPAAPDGQAVHGSAGGAGSAGSAGGAGGAGTTDDIRAERDEYLVALQRLQADFENYRKRVQRQQEEQAARAASSLVASVLPVLDTLDLALAHLVGAVRRDPAEEAGALEQARAQLLDVLGKEGLERVDTAGVDFDPSVHDAVARAATDPGAAEVPTDPGAAEAPATPGAAEAPATPGAAEAPATPGAAEAPTGPSLAVTVDEVLRAGYRWRGQVLRPAMVRVRG
ncbi:MAG: nucleotide exchange factor GrpE [Acidimicrobiales bacterium]